MLKNNMKEIRKIRKITQEELAREIDVSVRTIQNIERTSNTDITTAYKIKKALKANTIEEIFIE